MILEPRIHGCLLNRKCWGRLAINNVQFISEGISTTAFIQLCLPDDADAMNTKDLIYGRVQDHSGKEADKAPKIPDLLQDYTSGQYC